LTAALIALPPELFPERQWLDVSNTGCAIFIAAGCSSFNYINPSLASELLNLSSEVEDVRACKQLSTLASNR